MAFSYFSENLLEKYENIMQIISMDRLGVIKIIEYN